MTISIIIWLVIGAISGWVGFIATRSSESFKGIGLNIALGMVGALVGGIAATSLLGTEVTDETGAIGTFGALAFSVLLVMVVGVSDFFGKARSS